MQSPFDLSYSFGFGYELVLVSIVVEIWTSLDLVHSYHERLLSILRLGCVSYLCMYIIVFYCLRKFTEHP